MVIFYKSFVFHLCKIIFEETVHCGTVEAGKYFGSKQPPGHLFFWRLSHVVEKGKEVFILKLKHLKVLFFIILKVKYLKKIFRS